MTPQEALEKLDFLLSHGREIEWIERKEAKTNCDFDDLGKYFSALSNEANLYGQLYGWLIFGVANDGAVVGTRYRNDVKKLDSLKHEIAQHTSQQLSFVDILTIPHPTGKRVLLFQIPAALRGMPTSWKGHFYGRDGESLVALNMDEIERIRNQALSRDWSAEICPDATEDDLDIDAVKKAREELKKKSPAKSADIDRWNDTTFLNKAKITIQGKVTNAAILLLGREESAPFISPAVAKMSWVLKDARNGNIDYEHFGPPFILNVDRLFARVRNLKYRQMPSGTLFPMETMKYDPWVIREALHNCIAHQDYSLRGRINVVETPVSLMFTNVGSFLPGTVERVIEEDAPPEVYRNPFLSEAMVNLNMIDTQGGGIKKMYRTQMQRFFPMPTYDLSDPDRVVVTVHGEILDERYSRLLMQKADLDLWAVILLDKIQKRIQIPQEKAAVLRRQGLIEGRYPRLHVSAKIADLTEQKARYLHTRGLDEQYYANLILEHIRRFGSINRKEADELLFPKLPSILGEKQKKNKVNRLLSVILRDRIQNTASRSRPTYILKDTGENE
jgi:ATP-dependent DNA helicase RecG